MEQLALVLREVFFVRLEQRPPQPTVQDRTVRLAIGSALRTIYASGIGKGFWVEEKQ
jgi:hypothetical protein